jgi:hypothetical protein
MLCGTYGVEEKFIVFMLGKPEGKIPLGSPICRWEVHVKMVLKE